jgi:hypothetical protein
MTTLPSDAGDGAIGVTWPRHDIDAEWCWRWCCRDDLAVARYYCRVMLTMVLPSHAVVGAAKATWPQCDIDAMSCRQQCLLGLLGHRDFQIRASASWANSNEPPP